MDWPVEMINVLWITCQWQLITAAPVSSLDSKMDKLSLLISSQREFQECSMLCFTDTWLYEDISDSTASVPGFQIERVDKQAGLSGKKIDSGDTLFINYSLTWNTSL